jgi:hypothetical protein
MIRSNQESSGRIENSHIVGASQNHMPNKNTKRKQNRHLTVWDRQGERDKRLIENFEKNRINGTQNLSCPKYAGRC